MAGARTYIKAIGAGAALCIGGPALVWYITPTEEEIFKKYNPELQKRSLEQRGQRQQEFDDFVMKLREAAKSDKPIWTVQKEMEEKRVVDAAQRLRSDHNTLTDEAERLRAEIRSSAK